MLYIVGKLIPLGFRISMLESWIDKICRFYCCSTPQRCNFGNFCATFLLRILIFKYYFGLILKFRRESDFFIYMETFSETVCNILRELWHSIADLALFFMGFFMYVSFMEVKTTTLPSPRKFCLEQKMIESWNLKFGIFLANISIFFQKSAKISKTVLNFEHE